MGRNSAFWGDLGLFGKILLITFVPSFCCNETLLAKNLIKFLKKLKYEIYSIKVDLVDVTPCFIL
jgi:hypothetical protein